MKRTKMNDATKESNTPLNPSDPDDSSVLESIMEDMKSPEFLAIVKEREEREKAEMEQYKALKARFKRILQTKNNLLKQKMRVRSGVKRGGFVQKHKTLVSHSGEMNLENLLSTIKILQQKLSILRSEVNSIHFHNKPFN